MSPARRSGGRRAPRSVQVVIVSYESRAALLRLSRLPRPPRPPAARGHGRRQRQPRRLGPTPSARGTRRCSLLENARNEGFAAACNRGWRAGDAGFVLFLNPDAEVTPGAVETLAARLAARPEIAIVGPLTRNADGSVQVSTGPDLTPWTELAQRRLVRGVERRDPSLLAEAERRHAREHEPAWVSGACLMARRDALVAVDGFDEGFFLYEEDADLCRRVGQMGGRVLFTPGGRDPPSPRRQHGARAAARAPRLSRQSPALLPQAQRRRGRSSRCGSAIAAPWAGDASRSDGADARAEALALLRLAIHGA